MKNFILFITSCILLAAIDSNAYLVINEVCYENTDFKDESGDSTSDWIELYNSGPADVNINNYAIGDSSPYDEDKGTRLPDYTIPAGGFLVVFANSDLPETNAWISASDYTVIPENSSWKYWDEGYEPSTGWRDLSYTDSSWNEGISPIGHNTTLDSMDCATVLGDETVPSSLHQTIYCRINFDIQNPSVVTGLVMRARFKDGVAVYLNGNPIYRDNMPRIALTYSTLALTSVPSTTWTEELFSNEYLVQGSNVIALEIHKAVADGPAIIMDFSLEALVDELIPVVHGNFGLKKEGENVHLFNASLIRIDKCEAPTVEIGANRSWGTITDGNTTSFKVYTKPTPGLPNATYNTKYEETLTADIPSFSVSPGFYETSQNVTLSSSNLYYDRIYYTLDGSDPRDSTNSVLSGTTIALNMPSDITAGLAWKRTNPVETGSNVPGSEWLPPVAAIDKAVVLRAITVSYDGSNCSPERQGTFFMGSGYQNRKLPVFSLITDAENLYGFAKGLYIPGKQYADSPEGYGDNKWGKPYANYHQDNDNQDWEHPVHMELFETNQSSSVISAGMGFAMHGGGSRAIPQKTLYMLARNAEYGTDYINYQLFPDLPAVQYKRFLLRNSGNDWYGDTSSGIATMFKDAVMHRIAADLDISVMAFRPALVYINGEYWGIHNLRESYDKHYLATRYGIDADTADIVTHVEEDNNKINVVSIDGDTNADNEYEDMLDWMQLNSVSIEANYQQVTNQIDAENYADYIIAETFFGNTDWPQNNCDFWRTGTDQTSVAGEYGDGRWRWMLYDLDVSGEEGSAFNMFNYLSDSSMTAVDEPAFLINQLWSNIGFRNRFISRYADILNTSFHPLNTTGKITNASSRIAAEIETHFNRWGRTTSETQWMNSINSSLKTYLIERQNYLYIHLNSFFGLGGTGTLTVKNNDPSGTGGHLKIGTVDIVAGTDGVLNPAEWSGVYFRNIPVTVQAVPDPGYEFDGWVGTTTTSTQRTVNVGDSPITLIARFRTTGSEPYTAPGFEAWQINNYTEQQIIEGTVCSPEAPSGEAGMSNFELYAFGMNINDGLTDEQRQARAALSINAQPTGLYVGYNRLNDSHNDITYTLKAADELSSPMLWRNAIAGEDYLAVSLTNIQDSSTWYYQQKLNNADPDKPKLFFKLEIEPQ